MTGVGNLLQVSAPIPNDLIDLNNQFLLEFENLECRLSTGQYLSRNRVLIPLMLNRATYLYEPVTVQQVKGHHLQLR